MIDYDVTAWNVLAADTGQPQPVLTLDAFFTQAEASTATYDNLLGAPKPGASYLGQTYALNGAAVTNLPQRTTQPTTFAWVPGNLTGHTGVIGFGGVSRFVVSGGGVLLYGDFTLAYSAARIARGGSGWFLKGNIPPAAAAFDLLQPVVTETATGFSLSGDLGVSFEVANFLYATPADTLRVVGRFQFTGFSVQLPSDPPVIARCELVEGAVRLTGNGGLPEGNFTVESAFKIGPEALTWSTAATGQFDAEGRFTVSIPGATDSPGRWFRLVVP